MLFLLAGVASAATTSTKLIGTPSSGIAEQGASVALSADGNTAVVGAPGDNSNKGAAWVFVRSGQMWTQAAKLAPATAAAGDLVGISAAISGDGNTIALGAYPSGGGRGATYVFVNQGGSWIQQGSAIIAGDAIGNAHQGYSVALANDGNTLAIGGLTDNNNAGACWVYSRSGSQWSEQQKIGAQSVTGTVGAADLGPVALSGDGNTLLCGGPGDNNNTGAIWAFSRSGAAWAQSGTKIVGVNASHFGISPTLSFDGNTAAVGGATPDQSKYIFWTFSRSGNTWSEVGGASIGLGGPVALSSDGNTLVAGNPLASNNSGQINVFVRGADGMYRLNNTLAGTGETGAGQLGYAIAVSADASEALAGAPADNSGAGAAWVFTPLKAPPPVISSVSTITAQQTQTITISGSGFGTQAPYNGDSPFLSIKDITAGFDTGLTGDGITLNVTSWTDSQITIAGFTGNYGKDLNSFLQPGDQVQVSVTNPQTNAGPGAATATVSSTGSPAITSVSGILPQQTQTITITGRGFGTHAPYNGDSAFLLIRDVTAGWSAGFANSFTTDGVTLNVTSWTDAQIVISGFTGTYGQASSILNAGDQITVYVWNAQSGIGPAMFSLAPAVLSINSTHSGNFTAGQQGTYTVTVSNAMAAGPTAGTVLVTDTLPAGWTLVSMAGSGWSCTDTSCSRNDPLAAGSSYSPITVTVNVAANATSPQVNQVSVTGGGSVAATAMDSTVIATAVTVQTNPSGLQISVDGGSPLTAPQTIGLLPGNHHISVATTQAGATGTQYLFTAWNDGTSAATDAVVVGTAAVTYTAEFKTQYQLTTAASPVGAGTVTPASGFFDAGSMVNLSATPGNGFQFTSWTGPVTSPNNAATVISMTGPVTATANFVAVASITIQTMPAGLQFTVDNLAPQTAPQTLSLTAGSHIIAVLATQPGTTGTQYVFTGWNDGGTASHSITVSTAASFTATFKTQYQLTITASPAADGTVTPSSGFVDAGTVVSVSATANGGFQFIDWSGAVASSSSASTTVTMSGPQSLTANFAALAGVTIQTNPPGLQFTVDSGNPQTAPQTLNLQPGSHTVSVAPTQAGTAGTQYVFTNWNDGGTASHSFTVGTAPLALTATFKTQFQLTTAASPMPGGAVTPASGFVDANSVVNLTATANSGFQFANWTGPVAAVNSGTTTVTMSGPQAVTANFVPTAPITIQTNPTGLQFTVDGGAPQTAPQVLTLTAGSHTITVATTQTPAAGTQDLFTGWSDGGAATHSITVSAAAATYTATFRTQYQLTVSALPAAGGTVTPASGFVDAASVVPVAATANSGFIFGSWTGNVASASSASTTVTMTAPQTVVANFTAGQAPPAVTIFSPAQNATGVSTTVSLTWSAVVGATSYDVSFGTSASAPVVTTTTNLSYSPMNLAANTTYYWAVTAKNAFGATPSAVWSFTTAPATTSGYRFVPVTPCRIIDTRGAIGPFGGPAIPAQGTRTVPIPQSACNIPATALAYSLNVTVVPIQTLGYLSIWPAGQSQPVVSTLNSFDGSIVANAAIVPAGTQGAISVFASDATQAIIDINGYFAPASTANSMSFYSLTPCRVVDTRGAIGPLGGPVMSGGSARSFPVSSSPCGAPNTAQAYSLNITVVPRHTLGYLTSWPTGQTQPVVSTLNSPNGLIVANAAIVPAGTGGAISIFVTDDTDVIIDINGYFAPPGSPAAQSLYTVTPCRVADTRGGSSLADNGSSSFSIPTGPCSGIPNTAQAYSLNVTVVPSGPLGYLTAWPTGQTQPVVSTLNSPAGKVVANAAIVPAGTGGAVTVFVTNPTDLILDINAYFAP
ncbi:MAG TPA: hypothetical protein VKU01_13340 [Bryobacteraceae bacterium]|nr:hypothetical protein [Bryobacteraceae bacterium]